MKSPDSLSGTFFQIPQPQSQGLMGRQVGRTCLTAQSYVIMTGFRVRLEFESWIHLCKLCDLRNVT